MKRENLPWTHPKTEREDGGRSLESWMARLDAAATPQTAGAFGEIRGLYLAYKIAPSATLLEEMLCKCLALVLDGSKATPEFLPSTASVKGRRGDAMDYEFLLGFEYFLNEKKGITEATAQVYIRALKRVIRAHGITDVETLIERIDELIDAYQGKDQKAHNVHISVLKQFDAYVQDPNGFFIAVQKDGKEQIVSRIYSTITAAESEMDFVGDDYRGEADKVVLYDKFKRFVRERDL
jgi:hypothetical protein